MNLILILAATACLATFFAPPAWSQTYVPEPERAVISALASGKPTMLEFGAPWCASCVLMSPVVEAAARDRGLSRRVNVISINIDQAPALAARYHINSIPVQIFLDRSGAELRRHFGYMEKPELLDLLKKLFP